MHVCIVQSVAVGMCLAANEEEAIAEARRYLSYFPANFTEKPELKESVEAKVGRTLEAIIPENQNAPFDMYEAIDALIDEGSFFDVKKLFAP